MGLLDGKVIVITGAARGIGRAVARLFASEGGRIVVNDAGVERDGSGGGPAAADAAVEELLQSGGSAVSSYDSVDTMEGAKRIVRTALDAFGHIDTLVNAAGITRDSSLLRVDPAAWDAVLNVQLNGTFHCIRAVAEHMKTSGRGGRIVNTTGISGFLGAYGQAAASAANAGVYALTRTASIELQRHRITVNAVAPVAKTRLTEDLPLFEHVDTMTPEHVAPGYLFFGSDLAGDITGTVLAVAGARISACAMEESTGQFKEAQGGIWNAREIAEHWEAIGKGGGRSVGGL